MSLKRILFVLMIAALFSCSKSEEVPQLDLVQCEQYAKNVYRAIRDNDFDAYIALLAQKGDKGLDDQLLVDDYRFEEHHGLSWQDQVKRRYKNLRESIDKAGGVGTMTWDKMGKIIGYMPEYSEFVGNMYVEINVSGTPYVLEIAGTQLTRDRVRIAIGTGAANLKTWSYYQTNIVNRF